MFFKLVLIICCVATIRCIDVSEIIDKCHWDDKPCLIASSQKAVVPVAGGIPELKLPRLDPSHVELAEYKEGELSVIFEDITTTGTSKCKIIYVERKLEEYIIVKAECPIKVEGKYTASGKLLFVDVEGQGPFHVIANKVFFSIKVAVKTVEKKGVKYWKPTKYEFTYDCKEKAVIHLENLFNGDKQKAEPIEKILDSSWYEIIQTIGKPLVHAITENIMKSFKKLADTIPANQLEL